MDKKEIMRITRKLKKGEMSAFEVPEELKEDIKIISLERKLGMRITGKRGFDVISNTFFVEEELIDVNRNFGRNTFHVFDDFDSYYVFLNGDIYDNACYTFCSLIDKETIRSRKIDLKSLKKRRAFVEETIDDYTLSLTKREKEDYARGKKIHNSCKQWVKKFNNICSYNELAKTIENYEKSDMASIVDIDFFLFQYIFSNIEDEKCFSALMEYISSCDYPKYNILYALCRIYNPDDVVQMFTYSHGSKGTIYKHKKRLKDYVHQLRNGGIELESEAFFDLTTHYYCEKTIAYQKNSYSFPFTEVCRYFESFDEFIDYRKGDLRHCDLSNMIEDNINFSDYQIDETTLLPITKNLDAAYSIKKFYHDKKFYVMQQWTDASGKVIKEYEHCFDYFFDFVVFLKGDISHADLILCDGLANIEKWDSIDFTDAKMKSELCEKFGVGYDVYEEKSSLIGSFDYAEQNEIETALILQSSREPIDEEEGRSLDAFDLEYDHQYQRVSYISDIHLLHRIQNAGCRSKEDVMYVVRKIAETIAKEAGSLLLIDGDTSSDFDLFQLFVEALSQALYASTAVIFTLGNHELWGFPDLEIEQIVSKYRDVLDKHNMFLLQNDLFYKEDCNLLAPTYKTCHIIKFHDLCKMSEEQITECLRKARYVILGGMGFSGYNMEFNADNGIYRKTLDRKSEIRQSKILEDLYNQLYPVLSNKNTIILTHTPKIDWHIDKNLDSNIVYVSGHTHRNYFYDDGEYRAYADNQVGYHNESVHLKTFLIEKEYDLFSDYEDGIFEITSEQYKDFYRGKNISMTFNRKTNIIHMLKRNGYYCFIHESIYGILTILNGGLMKKLEHQDVQYYFDNMDAMIATIKSPLDKYTAFQKQISNTVKDIGEDGTIHGCIIDIDFWNHIYVNPIDLSLTGYWASDMVNKYVFPSIPALLEKNCPALYNKYYKLLQGKDDNLLVKNQKAELSILPQAYLSTDIYRASREIKKMQKLSSNILSFWYDSVIQEGSTSLPVPHGAIPTDSR